MTEIEAVFEFKNSELMGSDEIEMSAVDGAVEFTTVELTAEASIAEDSISGVVEDDIELSGEVQELVCQHDKYEGTTDVSPSVKENITLYTAGKLLEKDVVVKKISKRIVGNTVYIG